MTEARIGRDRMKENIVNKAEMLFALISAFGSGGGGGASDAAVLSAIFVGCGGASAAGAGVDFSSVVVVTTTVSAMSVKSGLVGGNKCGRIIWIFWYYWWFNAKINRFTKSIDLSSLFRNLGRDEKYLGKIRNYYLTLTL